MIKAGWGHVRLGKKREYTSYVGFECGGARIGLIPKLTEGHKADPIRRPRLEHPRHKTDRLERNFAKSAEGAKRKP